MPLVSLYSSRLLHVFTIITGLIIISYAVGTFNVYRIVPATIFQSNSKYDTHPVRNVITTNIDTHSDNMHRVRQYLLHKNYNKYNYCHAIWVKGIPKSGTTWLTSTLENIVEAVCTKHYSNAKITKPSICDRHQNIVRYKSTKHKPQLEGNLNDTHRECYVMVTRDIRDRALSRFRANRKITDHYDGHGIYNCDHGMYRKFNYFIKSGVKKLNTWYSIFETLENEHPLNVFTYFYQDFLHQNLHKTIEKLLLFLNFQDILDKNDISNIEYRMNFNVQQREHKNGTGGMRVTGKHCNFYSHIKNDECIININQYILENINDTRLIQKMNSSCYFSLTLHDTKQQRILHT